MMTLPEFRTALAGILPPMAGDVRLLETFIIRTDEWGGDMSTVTDLLKDLNRILGHVWFSDPAIHQRVFEAIEAFGKTVAALGGMTVNERLFSFGLLDLWDASSDELRRMLRLKVEAA
jgi:hypothetical protein